VKTRQARIDFFYLIKILINWSDNRKYGAQLLTARNVYQVMGNTLQEPTDFIVCYCDGTGGTANTLKIAKYFGIKHIFNYYDYLNSLDKVRRLVLNHALKKID